MSKIVQLGGFLFGALNTFSSPIKEIISSANSIKNLFGKELNNKVPQEIDNLFVDTGLNPNLGGLVFYPPVGFPFKTL